VPGYLLTNATVAMCPHGGQMMFIPSQARVLAGGAPVLLVTDPTLVAGCPFNVSGTPSPCLTVRWVAPADRVLVEGTPPLLSTSLGLCLNPTSAPQGTAVFVSYQQRVQAA
jgi:hypothetical protein